MRSNARPVRGGSGTPQIPSPVDAILTVQNCHGRHLKPFPAETTQSANAKLFSMLTRGGTLVVIDHVAASGSGLEAANALRGTTDPFASRFAKLKQRVPIDPQRSSRGCILRA